MYWETFKNLKILESLLLLTLLLGCGILEFENEQDTPYVLFPLAVGNYWEYEYTYLGSLYDTLRYEVVKQVEVPINDTTFTSFAFNLVPFPEGAPEYYWLFRNGDEGTYLMGGISDVDTLYMNALQVPFPAETGTSFLEPGLVFSYSELRFYHNESKVVTLIDTDREITTPAGTFSCYVFKFWVSNGYDVIKGWDYYQYYNPGIGLVAQISYTEDTLDDIKEEMYLMNYKVKK